MFHFLWNNMLKLDYIWVGLLRWGCLQVLGVYPIKPTRF